MAHNNTIAVLGTGIMGAAMARNLLAAGMEVRVWNRTREKAEPLADEGARVADTPAEATEGAGFVLTMLADADTVAQATGGENGALSPSRASLSVRSPIGPSGGTPGRPSGFRGTLSLIFLAAISRRCNHSRSRDSASASRRKTGASSPT